MENVHLKLNNLEFKNKIGNNKINIINKEIILVLNCVLFFLIIIVIQLKFKLDKIIKKERLNIMKT